MKKERAKWAVHTCGRDKNSVTNWEEERKTITLDLTEEEKKSKYAKYFYMPYDTPPDEFMKACERGNELPKEAAFLPDDYAKYMMTDLIETMRTGYCMMDNGIGYSCLRLPQVGVTHEAMKYFAEEYYPEGDLFYKSWCPGYHMRHYNGLAIEDLGCGMEYLDFTEYYTPESLGISSKEVEESEDCILVEGANMELSPYHTPGEHIRYCMETCFYRDTPYGQETFIHVWHGIHLIGGKSVRMIPEGESINIAELRAQTQHLVTEYMHVTKLITTLYEDWKNGKL